MRRSIFTFAAAAATAAPTTPQPVTLTKPQLLSKILTNDGVSFKNKVPVKSANIEQSFGKNWQQELGAAAQEEKVARQIRRLALTRYTSRELAAYLADGGVARLDANARAAQIADGQAYVATNGEQEFRALVAREGKLANWSAQQQQEFTDAVLKKK
eukprot:PhF_6_TR10179/c0_g1_i1/m.15785